MRGSTLGAILLPFFVLVGYGLATGIGFIWPERTGVSMVVSITVSLLLWLASAWWFRRRTGWWRWVCILLFVGVFLFPMVGSAQLGTNLALEKHGEPVVGEVVDIEVDQTNHREDQEAWRTTYTFVSTEDGSELGTLDYNGGKDAYELEVGDEADLLVDPRGKLPLKLADRVDSSSDIVLLVLGGVLFLFAYGIGLVWPLVRRGFSGLDWA